VWRAERGVATVEASVPLSFAPGEAYQFDWSPELASINGVTVTVKVAHVRLCHSRMLFVRNASFCLWQVAGKRVASSWSAQRPCHLFIMPDWRDFKLAEAVTKFGSK